MVSEKLPKHKLSHYILADVEHEKHLLHFAFSCLLAEVGLYPLPQLFNRIVSL
jgi:hypothetical protein